MVWFKKDLFSKEKKSPRFPRGLWVKCEHCNETIYKKEVERNLEVCPKCNYHFRISARRRIEIVADEGSFVEFDRGLGPVDAIDFRDLKRYKDRLRAAEKETAFKDAFVSAECKIDGQRALIGVFEFSFMGGSMGSVVGEKVTRLIERGASERTPVLIFSSSGGARMQEGILSLMQMAKTSAAIAGLKEKGVPYISVLTDPTMGGVTASFAMLGDIIMAEPRALVGFAGPRVIQETIKKTLPEGFQRAEYLLEHGMIDMIVERKNLKPTLSRLIGLLSWRF
jgi:acetyl-CoA carboxylase carboxyl transferase subunit beta